MLPIMRTNVRFEEKKIREFGGLNLTEDCAPGELFASENMSSVQSPALGVRCRRSLVSECDRIINGVGTFEGYVYTSYTTNEEKIFFTFKGVDYEYTSYSTSADFTTNRKIAALADSVLIIPDNVIFFTNSRRFSRICISETHTKTTALNKFDQETDGNKLLAGITIRYIATLAHDSIECMNATYSHDGSRIFYYSSFDTSLKSGDVITIKGDIFSERDYGDDEYYQYQKKIKAGLTLKIKSVTTVTHETPTGTITETVALQFDDDTLDTGGYRDLCFKTLSIERGIPALSDICSFNNRIWAISGKQIYASKLSDPSEWNDFTSDEYGTMPYASFNTSAQTEGDFTGIIPYKNCIYAFKENSIHKIMGDAPDEYTLHSVFARGVGKNMGATLAICDDSLIYCSDDGIYTYTGDYPKKISDKLGSIPAGICAAATAEFYYILCESGNEQVFFVYDSKRKIWHRETADNKYTHLGAFGGTVFGAHENSIILLNPKEETANTEKDVHWSFKIKFDEKLFEKKGFGKLSIRYSLAKNASFTVRAVYDDKSRGAVCGARYDQIESGGYALDMPIKRCLWFVLEFEGTGDFTLKSMNMKFYRGSEI